MTPKAQIKFDYTLQKNICMFIKRQGGNCLTEMIHQEYPQESSFVIDAMLRNLKNKKYISMDDKEIYLDLFIYDQLSV